MKRIAVLTSGGDAPGMNAAIRAVVRTGARQGAGDLRRPPRLRRPDQPADRCRSAPRDVGGILQRGGTFLGSARVRGVQERRRRGPCARALRKRGIDGLVVIGGNGSQTGAHALSSRLAVVGVASTIDNDLCGSEITIGVDTALNIALEAIDRLKVTASSHQRAFLVEVMGRNCGYLALMAGIAGGAEAVVIPESEIDPGRARGGVRAAPTSAANRTPWWWSPKGRGTTRSGLAKLLRGAPGTAGLRPARDHPGARPARRRAQRLRPPAGDPAGAAAAEHLARGEPGVLVGMQRSEITATPLGEIHGKQKCLNLELFAVRPKSCEVVLPNESGTSRKSLPVLRAR